MQREDPPFKLGETLNGKDSAGNLINYDKLGIVHQFYSVPASSLRGGKTPPAFGHAVRAIALRNTAGFALLAKRMGLVSVVAGYVGVSEIVGYSVTLNAGPVVLIDPWLASAGVPDDDIFWGIIGGPALTRTPSVGADFNGNIAVGSTLVAATGSTSGDTAGGRVSNLKIASATDADGAMRAANAALCRALSARTTGETNADLLVEMMAARWFGG
jgi:hypothetical protein